MLRQPRKWNRIARVSEAVTDAYRGRPGAKARR
jgi:hypothetical protein